MTYYEILQISETASPEIIRAAYMALAKKYLPDLSKDNPTQAEETMKQLNTAYETLSDPIKRQNYDLQLRIQRTHQSSYQSNTSQYSQTQPNHQTYTQPPKKEPKKRIKTGLGIWFVVLLVSITVLGIFSAAGFFLEEPNNTPPKTTSTPTETTSTPDKMTFSEWSKAKREWESEKEKGKTNQSFSEWLKAEYGVIWPKTTPAETTTTPDGMTYSEWIKAKREKEAQEESLTPVAEPTTGTLLKGYKYNDASKITVTASESEACVVKLKDIYGNTTLSFYVRAGQSATVDVPRATLYVYFASGKTWYGKENLFGENTSYSKDDDAVDFAKHTCSYTLYPVTNGNFSETPIDAAEFFD